MCFNFDMSSVCRYICAILFLLIEMSKERIGVRSVFYMGLHIILDYTSCEY